MEKNRAERKEVQILGKVTVEKSSTSFHCNTVNLSLTGALIEMGVALASGSILNFAFRVPGVKNPLNIPSEVVRKEGSEAAVHESASRGGLYRYGIRFLEMNQEEKEALARYFSRVAIERTFPSR